MVKYAPLTNSSLVRFWTIVMPQLSFNNNDIYAISFHLAHFYYTYFKKHCVLHGTNLEKLWLYKWPPMQTSLAPCVHFRNKFLGFELIPAFFKHISCLQALRYLISLYLNGKFLEISTEMEKEKKWHYFNSNILYDHLKYYLHLEFKTVKKWKLQGAIIFVWYV